MKEKQGGKDAETNEKEKEDGKEGWEKEWRKILIFDENEFMMNHDEYLYLTEGRREKIEPFGWTDWPATDAERERERERERQRHHRWKTKSPQKKTS